MTLNVPQIKINNSNSATSTGISNEIKDSRHAQNPSFGAKWPKNPMEKFIINPIVFLFHEKEFAKNKYTHRIITWFDRNISSPENRLILGATALATQPFIDLNNKKVDKKTRVVSCARTIAKIIAGTITGLTIRAGFIKFVRHCSAVGKVGDNALINVGRAGIKKEINIVIKKFRQIFTPHSNAEVEIKSQGSHAYKQYQDTMGSVLAIVTMIFTNFLIDKPLTTFLTNKINKKFENVKFDPEPPKTGGSK